jgi:NTE family protein
MFRGESMSVDDSGALAPTVSDVPGPPRAATVRKPVALALQGGGSYGAYTWGVLDVLLASRHVAIRQLSGTSAGALNAAIVASALARGTAADARRALRSFWMTIAQPAAADLGREVWGPMERHWRETIATWLVSGSAYSPYVGNPLGVNPLRAAIDAHVDVDALRSATAPALHVTVTNVRTGLPRVVSNEAMSVEVLLASACLPQLFQAVEIDGEPYWDGGYCANPTLRPIVDGDARDLIVVQLAPDTVERVPRDAAAIQRRIGQIVFHSSLVSELHSIAAMRDVAARGDASEAVLALRLHRIGPPQADLIDAGSPLERSRAWIEQLYEAGRDAARGFLARHRHDLGSRETLDVGRLLAGEHGDPRAPANEPDFRARATASGAGARS